HVAYDAVTGNITAGIGAVGADAPILIGTFTGGTVYDLWNTDADDDLLLVSLFIRSQDLGIAGAPLSSGSSNAVFSDLRVISGNAIAVPEPSSLACLSVIAIAGCVRRTRHGPLARCDH
ncbi:MAG: hypothetical protein AAF664_15045, partial [Planctomycetota bacterium]